MHLANSYYGHDRALRSYAGAPVDQPLGGMLQHGWNEGTGFTPHDPPAPLRRVLPCFVWNGSNLAQARAVGYGAVSALGAPFLYLERVMQASTHVASSHEVIAYPFHTWERQKKTGGSHGEYARQIAERDGAVTACLYWLEYEHPEIRAAYEAAGHRVICHGRREDPLFLVRQLEALRQHRRMVTNRVSTALWYAMAMSLEVELYGPRMGVTSEVVLQREYEVHRRRWPALFEGPLAGAAAAELASEQLGAEHLREPEELRTLLGFVGRRRVTASLAPLTRTLMRVKKRVEGW